MGEWGLSPRRGWRSRTCEKGSLPPCTGNSVAPNLSCRSCTTGTPTAHTTPQSSSSTKEGSRLDAGVCASTLCFPPFILVSLLLLRMSSTGWRNLGFYTSVFLYLFFCSLRCQILDKYIRRSGKTISLERTASSSLFASEFWVSFSSVITLYLQSVGC